jgi:carboxypeptidase Q
MSSGFVAIPRWMAANDPTQLHLKWWHPGIHMIAQKLFAMKPVMWPQIAALIIALYVSGVAAQPPPLPQHLAADAAAIIALASSMNTSGWNRLADWVDIHGARLSGSLQLEKALDYALATMRADGFDNVHEEVVNVTQWTRGTEALKMISPYNKTLNFLSIGSSVGTGGAALVAPVLVVASFDELTARKSEATGKIVVFNYFCDWATLGGLACYEKSAGYRSVGANAAAAVGAVAVLVRSLTEYSLGTPHTVSQYACIERVNVLLGHAAFAAFLQYL